ncbi:TetR/AcrR family transcriptional regulator [Pseudonocardia nantongensis]|uniref:TetR/AcrR family transcriptional regulator n=1 Tax=Pseudonocardia nantongensis TaxID=1181885 RepID=UPI00397C6B8A
MSDNSEGDTPGRANPARPNRRAEGKARTREAVLSAAGTVFAERGYGSASVEEIARQAGVAIGSVYAHFGGKQALFAALIARTTADNLDGATGTLAEGPDDQGMLDRLGAQLAETADDRVRALLDAETWLYAIRNDDELATALADDDRRTRASIARILAEQPAPEPGPLLSTEELATVLTGLFHGLVRQRRMDPGSVPDSLFGRAMGLVNALTAHHTDAAPDPADGRKPGSTAD